MQIQDQTNSYQAINSYQKPNNSIQPVPPKEPEYSNKDIYNASNGNLIRLRDGKIGLTPQGELNVAKAEQEKTNQTDAKAQAKEDGERSFAAGYIGAQSKKSQVEIYLAVATNSKVSLGDDDTPSIIESLRNVQKQNSAIEAYATYQENQKGGEPALY